MNGLLVRSVLAFLALPGVVAFGVPVLLVARGAPIERRITPIASATFLLAVGIGLLLWCVREFYAAVVAPVVHLRVVYHEEPFLARSHGHAWDAYAARVPRWIGPVRRRDPDPLLT